jgi:L-amino acid N-acyltransferase YncA
MEVRDLRSGDWPEVARIYGEGIRSGDATFDTEVPPWEAWDAAHLPGHRLVAERDGAVLGWAALSPVSERCCYAGVAEVSVYVAPEAQEQGVGRALLERLVEGSETAGLWTLQAGIFAENVGSVGLHQACGFRVVGRRERLGQLAGEWRDVLLLERRSAHV